MSIRFPSAAIAIALSSGAAWADVPDVVTDIAPVHSLVARIMEGVGTPDLILPQNASPHGFALRPSQAAALQNADLVFWVSENLTPWLGEALETLAPDAVSIELLEVADTRVLPIRTGATFEAHDHDDHAEEHDEDHDDHADHEDHADHGHEEHHDDDHGDHADGHDDHAEDHADHGHDEHHDDHDGHDDHDEEGHAGDHAGHDHSGIDPHAWLDPLNAAVWAQAIAETLAQADPENALSYQANADNLLMELGDLVADVNAEFSMSSPIGFIVFHDAYQYFESRFGLSPLGAISLSDATAPSAGRVAEIRERIAELGGTCVFAEPQFDPRIVATVTEGTQTSTAVIDPLGSGLDIGAGLYPALIRAMAESFQSCG